MAIFFFDTDNVIIPEAVLPTSPLIKVASDVAPTHRNSARVVAVVTQFSLHEKAFTTVILYRIFKLISEEDRRNNQEAGTKTRFYLFSYSRAY